MPRRVTPRRSSSRICAELFRDIDADTVDFVDNYDGYHAGADAAADDVPERPRLGQHGHRGRHGVATSARFNLARGLPDDDRAASKTRTHDIFSTHCRRRISRPAASCSMTRRRCSQIYETRPRLVHACARNGATTRRGTLSRSTEIPYTTTTETIIDKVAELIKAGKVREIARHARRDRPERPQARHRPQARRRPGQADGRSCSRLTTLAGQLSAATSTSSSRGMPRVLGVREIFEEWTAWRTECVRRRVYLPDSDKKKDKLHLLQGLAQNPARHRQGHRHHPRDRAGRGGHPEPDDRLRHRPGAGRIRRGDQACATSTRNIS